MHIEKTIAVVVSLSVMLSTAGCSVLGLIYEHAYWLAMRYAGRYVNFDDEREQTLRSALRERLEIHRREELSGYVAFLWNTEQMLSDGLTANEAGELLSGIRRLYDRTARRTLPYITPTLTTLTDAQIDELVDNIEQRNQDYREKYLADHTEVRHQNRVEGIAERLERWTGNLTKEQLDLLDERLRSSTDPVPRWFEYRHTKQGIHRASKTQTQRRATLRVPRQLVD